MEKIEIETLTAGRNLPARLLVKRDSKIICDVQITADALADGINKLANARSVIGEDVTPTLDPVVRLPEVDYPKWLIPNYTDGGDRLLVIRHPAVGWTSFRLTQKDADEIAQWLTKKVEDRPHRSVPTRK